MSPRIEGNCTQRKEVPISLSQHSYADLAIVEAAARGADQDLSVNAEDLLNAQNTCVVAARSDQGRPIVLLKSLLLVQLPISGQSMRICHLTKCMLRQSVQPTPMQRMAWQLVCGITGQGM